MEAILIKAVTLRTTLGDRFEAKPLELSMPVLIAPMSYGALSKSTKIALARASRFSGTVENTGEGGMLPEQRKEAAQLIFQCLSGRLGWNIHDMLLADALEIYISQGAKPGLGGQLMAKKVTKELAAIRGIPAGIDLRSPSRHPDILGADDLVIKVEELREATGYSKPISVKLGAGRVRDDIKIAYKDGFDFVQLDGLQGSTGAASSEVLENVGIPTLAALQEALDGLNEIGHKGDMPIVLMGGIKDGVDAVKALALGAGAVAMGTAALIAGGCISCMQCHVGNCVVGIATQDPEHEARYKLDLQAQAIHRFLEAVRWQIAALTMALGHRDFRQLSRDDLVALTPEAAAITGLPFDPLLSRPRHPAPHAGGVVMASCKPFSVDLTSDQSKLPHYVPPPCQVACPIGTDVGSYVGLIWQGDKEGCVGGNHRDQSAVRNLRTGLRCALRTGLPARECRRPGGDPRAEALCSRCAWPDLQTGARQSR